MDACELNTEKTALDNLPLIDRNLIDKNPYLLKYIEIDRLQKIRETNCIAKLEAIIQDGFDNPHLSSLYSNYQNDPKYGKVRLKGWSLLFQNIFLHLLRASKNERLIIIDFLAGSGTLAKRARTLWKKNPPFVFGLDVSKQMVSKAHEKNEIVFWGSHEHHAFKPMCADVAIAAYGFHHISINERKEFVIAMYNVLKDDGICILHDFADGSVSAKFYSELIHNYRPTGHTCTHTSHIELGMLFSNCFKKNEISLMYDPFYLEGEIGQSAQSLKKEFLHYLICMFDLEKLLPNNVDYNGLRNYHEDLYWANVEQIITPFFDLTYQEFIALKENKMKHHDSASCNLISIDVPIVQSLSIISIDNDRLALIAPRAALVGIGKKG